MILCIAGLWRSRRSALLLLLAIVACKPVVGEDINNDLIASLVAMEESVLPLSFKLETVVEANSGESRTRGGRLAAGQDCFLWLDYQFSGGATGYSSNPDYSFSMRRQSTESPWLLTKFYSKQVPSDMLEDWQRVAGGRFRGYSIGTLPIWQLLKEKSVIVQDASIASDGQSATIICVSDTANTESDQPNLDFSRLVINLVKRENWVIANYQKRTRDDIDQQCTFDDWQSVSGTDYPVLSVLAYNNATVTTRMSDYTNQPISRSEFYLTAFGLPEPAAPPSLLANEYIWMILIAGALFSIAFFLKLRRRTHATN